MTGRRHHACSAHRSFCRRSSSRIATSPSARRPRHRRAAHPPARCAPHDRAMIGDRRGVGALRVVPRAGRSHRSQRRHRLRRHEPAAEIQPGRPAHLDDEGAAASATCAPPSAPDLSGEPDHRLARPRTAARRRSDRRQQRSSTNGSLEALYKRIGGRSHADCQQRRGKRWRPRTRGSRVRRELNAQPATRCAARDRLATSRDVLCPFLLCCVRRAAPPAHLALACLTKHVRGVLRVRSAAVQPDAGSSLPVPKRIARRRAATGVAGHPPQGRLHRPHRRHRHRQDHAVPHPARAVRSDHVHGADPQSVPVGRRAAARGAAQFRRRVEGRAQDRPAGDGQQARADPHAARLSAVAGAAARQRRADHRRGAAPVDRRARRDPDPVEPRDQRSEAAADRDRRAAEPARRAGHETSCGSSISAFRSAAR